MFWNNIRSNYFDPIISCVHKLFTSRMFVLATLFEKNSNCRLREDVLNHIKSWMRNKCDVQKRLSNKFSITNVDVSDDVDRKVRL